MNELIERLAYQAGIVLSDSGLCIGHKDELEAFAKAVARECAEIAEVCDDTDQSYRVIRERFGL